MIIICRGGPELDYHGQPTIQRLVGLAIYWFSYFLYRRYSTWSHFLRAYLQELEASGKTTIELQTRASRYMAGFGKARAIQIFCLFFSVTYINILILLLVCLVYV